MHAPSAKILAFAAVFLFFSEKKKGKFEMKKSLEQF
jgi:hypothetical protein